MVEPGEAAVRSARKRQKVPSRIGLFLLMAWLGLLALAVGPFEHCHSHRSNETPCRENLERLGEIYLARSAAHPDVRPRSGPALFREYRKNGDVPLGEEETLLCPGDQGVVFPSMEEDRALYDSLDLDDSTAWSDHISYAVRDFERFPVPEGDEDTTIIAADRCGVNGRCPHHEDGLLVLYADGDVDFLDWDDVGVVYDPDAKGWLSLDPSPVGPSSPHVELAKLVSPR